MKYRPSKSGKDSGQPNWQPPTSLNYQWTGSDGVICRSHTVAAKGASADRRSSKQNLRPDSIDYAYD